MFNAVVIGHLGGDAEVKTSNGREFTVFRVAHTSRWADDAGQIHEELIWVDCTMPGKPAVVEFLKKGQQVFVSGSVSLRVYSSKKDRCMKAGCTVSVKQIELLGGKPDEVPNKLYRTDNNAEVSVAKFYWSEDIVTNANFEEKLELVSRSQKKFIANKEGYIFPVKDNPTEDAE